MEGSDRLRIRLEQMLERARNLEQPLNAAGVAVRDAAVNRIKQQGGDQSWPPNKRGGHTGIDTGRMMGSLAVSQVGPGTVQVGTNVFYARFFQEGTGVFAGRSAWVVRPKAGKALHWFDQGGEHFAKSVTIPGQPSRPFLLIGSNERALIERIFTRWIGEGA